MLISVLLALSLFSGRVQGQTVGETWTLTVDGAERRALVFMPPKVGDGRCPVVFAFHGHGGNRNSAARTFHLLREWPEAIVVYMEGLPTATRNDPQGLRNGWQPDRGSNGDRDLHVFDAVLKKLRDSGRADEKRVFAMGIQTAARSPICSGRSAATRLRRSLPRALRACALSPAQSQSRCSTLPGAPTPLSRSCRSSSP